MSDKVLIITINYQQKKFTLDCIESLLKSDYPNFQILLIDNIPDQSYADDLKQLLPSDKRIIYKALFPNRGYVGGVNYGLSLGTELQADYFLIMNNDTLIDDLAIKNLVECCKIHNNLAIVTGKVLDYNNPQIIQQLGSNFSNSNFLLYKPIGINEADSGQYDIEQSRDMIDDVFWLFPVELYTKLGGYSEYFWFNSEQADFALRAKKIGYNLIYTPKAKIWHKGSPSIGGRNYNPVHVYWSVQSSLILRFLHLPFKYFAFYYFRTAYSIISTYLKSVLMLFKSEYRFKYAYAKLKGFIYFNRWLVTKQKNNGINPFIKK